MEKVTIGVNIRDIRKRKGLSQVELSKKVNVTQSMLCQIERGTKVPSLPLSVDIAAVLDCTLDDILEGG